MLWLWYVLCTSSQPTKLSANNGQCSGLNKAGSPRHGIWQEGLLSREGACVSFHEVDALGGGGKWAPCCQGQHPLSKGVKGSKLMHFGWKHWQQNLRKADAANRTQIISESQRMWAQPPSQCQNHNSAKQTGRGGDRDSRLAHGLEVGWARRQLCSEEGWLWRGFLLPLNLA